jgi:hypothetical protein
LKGIAILLAAALLLAGCNLRYALLGFPQPVVEVAGTAPIELGYREAKGGVILRGRVKCKADVDFILDTGAPVTVLIDGTQTAALGLDSSRARPLGGAHIPVAAPVYSASPNAVDDRRTSTIGIGLFNDRRVIIDYPGRRLLL